MYKTYLSKLSQAVTTTRSVPRCYFNRSAPLCCLNGTREKVEDEALLVCGSGVGGTSKSIVFAFQDKRYIFNAGEGSQRVIVGSRWKVGRVDSIFITYRSWENVAGLLTLHLGLKIVPKEKRTAINLYGPRDIEKIVTKSYKFAESSVSEAVVKNPSDVHKDDSIEVRPIFIEKQTKTISSCSREQKKENLWTSLEPDDAVEDQGTEKRGTEQYGDMAIMYCIHPVPKQRKINLMKCVEHGITTNAELIKIQEEGSVINKEEKVVHLQDVLYPAKSSRPILVVECPGEEFLSTLVNKSDLEQYYSHSVCEDTAVEVIAHFTPLHIVMNPLYKEWMARFGKKTKHLMVNELGSAVANSRPYVMQAKLNLIHSEIFPLLSLQVQKEIKPPAVVEAIEEFKQAGLDVTRAQTGLAYRLCSSENGFSWDGCNRHEETDNVINDMLKIKTIKDSLRTCHNTIEELNKTSDVSDKGFSQEVVFLGTGSAIPSNYRNASGILFHSSPSSAILLDCGEGIYSQMCQFYGRDHIDDLLLKIKAIYLSHLHADHHTGVITLAKKRYQVLRERQMDLTPLVLIAPQSILLWYININFFPINSILRVVPVDRFLRTQMHSSNHDLLFDELGLSSIKTVRVIHPQQAHAVVLTTKDNKKIAYSGDTAPCNNFIKAGEGCDLLIHEATLDDSLVANARKSRHSTMSQAIRVGEDMKAKFTLLTHFSQRYHHVPLLDNVSDTTGIAFDNMRVRLDQLHLLPHFIPVVNAFFPESLSKLRIRAQWRDYENSIDSAYS